MTRKDYEFIARVIRDIPTHSATLRAQRQSCATAFAAALEPTNPQFDRERFLAACLTGCGKRPSQRF